MIIIEPPSSTRYIRCFYVNSSLCSSCFHVSHNAAISDVNPARTGDGDPTSPTVLGVSIHDIEKGEENPAFEDVGTFHDVRGGNARKEMDTAEPKLQKSVFRDGCFQNPWLGWKNPTLGRVLKFVLFSKDHSNVPDKEVIYTTLSFA